MRRHQPTVASGLPSTRRRGTNGQAGAESFDRGGWAFKFDQGDEGQRFKFDELMAAESLLLGRITYEGFALGPARGPGGDVLVNGSAELVQALVENDLVDEYRLMVFPIVLHVRGEGQGLKRAARCEGLLCDA